MACGTATAATVSPAIVSRAKRRGEYCRSESKAGTERKNASRSDRTFSPLAAFRTGTSVIHETWVRLPVQWRKNEPAFGRVTTFPCITGRLGRNKDAASAASTHVT